tara:strand:+ start:4322 stop:5038 length:717 start_codon:yes stop_codon:yes gene_type:complete
MFKIFFNLFLVLTLNIVYCSYVFADNNSDINEFLNEREQIWPNWSSRNLRSSNIKKDLIYPSWFEGYWIVTSTDVRDTLEDPLVYKVNFYKNELGEIVSNRTLNSESIGKALFGNKLIKVKNDPKSINNQFIYLSDDEYIESRITERNQIRNNDLFFADEFVIQTVHRPSASRINQVEIMSKFYKCNSVELTESSTQNKNICGFQYLATYGSKVGEKNIKPISQNKYKLTFKYLGKTH